jgi:hypothetical protein
MMMMLILLLLLLLLMMMMMMTTTMMMMNPRAFNSGEFLWFSFHYQVPEVPILSADVIQGICIAGAAVEHHRRARSPFLRALRVFVAGVYFGDSLGYRGHHVCVAYIVQKSGDPNCCSQ